MSRVLVMGDIHGAYKALEQCLERSNFNKEEDTLIQLGDVADGWSDVFKCVEELLTIKNLIAIRGNHDDWFNTFLETSTHPIDWLQGGSATLKSYCEALDKLYYNKMSGGYNTNLLNSDVPQTHLDFFRKQIKYYRHNDQIFVHGGFNRHFLLKDQYADSIFWWDRDLWMEALSCKSLQDQNDGLLEANGFKVRFNVKEPCKEIFIGHTTTKMWKKTEPMQAAKIWNLDTGCGFGDGKLTIMDVETKEFWQSDPANSLYPDEKGR